MMPRWSRPSAFAQLPAWRRNQYVTVAAVFVVFTGFAFVIPFLPLYVRALGVRDEAAIALWSGVLIGVTPLVAGLMAPAWGRLADRVGHRPMILRALAAYVLLMAATAAVTHVGQLLALRILVGLFGGIGPLGLAMVTAAAPREQTGHAVGLVQSAQILSAAVGPVTGGLLADWLGMRATFVVTSAVCLAALVLVARYYEDAPRGAAPEERAGPAPGRPARAGSFLEVLALPGLPVLMATLFFVNFIGRSFTPILPLYMQGLGAEPGRLALLTGALISAYSMAAALSASHFGRATRTRSPHTLLLVGLLGGALGVVPMALAPSVGVAMALATLLGLASGGALTVCYTIGGLLVTDRVRATAFGFLSAAALFGGAVSPSVAGLLARWDLHGIFYLDGVLFVLLAALAVPALRARQRADEARAAPEVA